MSCLIIDYICSMKKNKIETIIYELHPYATEDICMEVVNLFSEKHPKFKYKKLSISCNNDCDFMMYRQSFFFELTKKVKGIPMKFVKLFTISSLKGDFKDLINNGCTIQHVKDLDTYFAVFEVIRPT